MKEGNVRPNFGFNAGTLRRWALAITIVAAGMAIAAWFAYRGFSHGLPSLSRLEEEARPVGGTLVFGARGDTLCSFYREKRVNVALDEVPAHLKEAVLSVEDWRFYEHWGIDLLGLIRATTTNVRRGASVQGASTLTQQLARNLFLTHDRTFKRKIQEAILALRIERTYTKDEIFRLYLNQIYFGEGAHGIEAAARTYFGKSARDLDRLEAATLAGLPKNPKNYSPLDHPERATRRRNVVLRTLLDHGRLERNEFERLCAQPLVTRPGGDTESVAPYFCEEIRKHIESTYGVKQLYEDELRVYTTLDRDLQKVAERALETRFTELEASLNLPHPRAQYARQLQRDPESPPRYLQGAIVAIEPGTGRILAMVGGRDFSESRFNRAVQARRQPGSCFKPFVFATAVQQGIGPSEILLDTPLVLEMGGGRGLWKPQNYSQTFSGPVSMRTSLAKSLNIPSIKLQQRVGTDAVIATAKQMGITSPLEPVLSLALGTSEVTLLELTSAYGTLAHGGITARPYSIDRIEDRDGRILERAAEFHEEALDPQTAYIVTSMLESAIDYGTGHNARDLYGVTIPAAGKTGTTDDLGDGWFVGYTPDLVVGVWGGFDERRPIGAAGSYIALPPWCDIVRDYTATRPRRDFPRPEGITTATICIDSGRLATSYCTHVQTESFSAKTRPRAECDLHTVAGVDANADAELRGLDAHPNEELAPPAPDQR
jgi:penicillin-binding protein 1A